MTERKHVFTIQPYGYTVEVVVTTDILESRKHYDEFLGHSFKSDDVDAVGLHCYNAIKPRSIIILPFKSSVPNIVHECFHCTARMFRLYEAELCMKTEESYAYTLDYIVSEVYAFVKGAKK